jgi:hypothetical protein
MANELELCELDELLLELDELCELEELLTLDELLLTAKLLEEELELWELDCELEEEL